MNVLFLNLSLKTYISVKTFVIKCVRTSLVLIEFFRMSFDPEYNRKDQSYMNFNSGKHILL